MRDTTDILRCRARAGLQMHFFSKASASTSRAVRSIVATLLAAACTASVFAEGFDPLSNVDQLEGATVVKAGNISPMPGLNAPSADQFGTRAPRLYQLGLYCFQSTGDEELSSKAGLLMLDRFGNTSVSVLTEFINTVKVENYPITVYDCRALMQQQFRRSTDDLKRQLEALKRQQEALEKLQRSLKQGGKTGATP